MDKNTFDKITGIIGASKLWANHAYHYHWVSGSSTLVHPITVWTPNREIVIQMDRDKYRGRTQAIRTLIKNLTSVISVKDWCYNPNDGSCPPELTIWYNE